MKVLGSAILKSTAKRMFKDKMCYFVILDDPSDAKAFSMTFKCSEELYNKVQDIPVASECAVAFNIHSSKFGRKVDVVELDVYK